ncbi:MAG: FAD-dependent oxidoreductase, partial [Bacteroidota bacterium]
MKGFPKSNINREQQLNLLTATDAVWDLLVIGGGATGLGIALDATSRGYKTALVEQSDFAKGTSSRSTKLVHGGVRYLAQGDVKLVREASIERGLLCRNAPHLVKNQTFIIPVYSYWDVLKYTTGLKLYDW